MTNLDTYDFPYEVKELKQDGFFVGIGSPFGGQPDKGRDIVQEGAFTKTLGENGPNGDGIWPFLWHHDVRSPIGVINAAKELKEGLQIAGQYALDTAQGHDAHVLAKMGAARQLSIGYNADDEEIDRKDNIRYLKSVTLMEMSQVTFGMAGTRARITGIKSLREAKTARELEHALREEGLSIKASKYVVSLCRPALREEGKAEGAQFKDLLNVMRQQRAEAQAFRAVRL